MLTIKISETVTKELITEKKVAVPAFWKHNNFREYVAVLNEQAAIKMYVSNSGNYSSLQHGTPEEMQEQIKEAYINFSPCTEEEFMQEYDDLTSAIALRPKLNESFTESLETVMK